MLTVACSALQKLVKTTYQKLTGLSFDGFGEGGGVRAGSPDDPSAAVASASPAPPPPGSVNTASGAPIPKKRGRPPKHHDQPQPQAQSYSPVIASGHSQGHHQQHSSTQGKKGKAPADEKPVTLTKWLTNKVDDLQATTDTQ